MFLTDVLNKLIHPVVKYIRQSGLGSGLIPPLITAAFLINLTNQ
jgi:hypothetical protein